MAGAAVGLISGNFVSYAAARSGLRDKSNEHKIMVRCSELANRRILPPHARSDRVQGRLSQLVCLELTHDYPFSVRFRTHFSHQLHCTIKCGCFFVKT